jgi:hypothetical protein
MVEVKEQISMKIKFFFICILLIVFPGLTFSQDTEEELESLFETFGEETPEVDTSAAAEEIDLFDFFEAEPSPEKESIPPEEEIVPVEDLFAPSPKPSRSTRKKAEPPPTSVEEFVEEPAEIAVEFPREKVTLEPPGLGVRFAVASPAYVSQTLTYWNSKIDYRFRIEYPFSFKIFGRYVQLGTEVSTFEFINVMPPKEGEFKGKGYFLTLAVPFKYLDISLGFGTMRASFGYFVEQSYLVRIYKRFYLSLGFRLTYVADMEGKGHASWVDGSLSPRFHKY